MKRACAVLSPVTCPAVQYFSTLSPEWYDFWKRKVIQQKKSVFWFSLQILSDSFLLLRRTERDIIENVHTSSCTVPSFLSDFSESWILSTEFRKILKYQISWTFVQWELSSMQTDGQTDMTKLVRVVFHNFANAPKNQSVDAVQGNNRCLFWDPHKTHKHSCMGRT